MCKFLQILKNAEKCAISHYDRRRYSWERTGFPARNAAEGPAEVLVPEGVDDGRVRGGAADDLAGHESEQKFSKTLAKLQQNFSKLLANF